MLMEIQLMRKKFQIDMKKLKHSDNVEISATTNDIKIDTSDFTPIKKVEKIIYQRVDTPL